MLKNHFDAIEKYIPALSKIQENTGHSIHKGAPREAFVKEFLQRHLGEQIAIGTGEIISADSKPSEPRNQFDLVIYRNDYPKIDFGGGINGFLVESVIATIEVKSTLRQEDLAQSIKAARNIKKLKRHIFPSISTRRQWKNVLSYVVAYNGPAKMKTVYDWINPIYLSEGIAYPSMDQTKSRVVNFPSLSIDGIFVLGKGFVIFHNSPINFLEEDVYNQNPEIKWEVADSSDGNLLLLFLILTFVSTNILDPTPYVKGFSMPDENITSGP
jgi:hypothetical protein